MSSTDVLLRAIQNGILLGRSTFEDIDADEVLSGRDEPDFDSEWVRLFEQLKDITLDDDETRKINQLREVAFKATFKSCSDPDLSGYVSDDFEVIAIGAFSELEDAFLSALLEAYAGDSIPHGTLPPSELELSSLINAIEQRL